MGKVALQADLCYNEAINIVRRASAVNTNPTLINLLRRLIVDILSQKTCSNPKCENPLLPATPEFFYRNHKTRDGLTERCKPCIKKQQAKSQQYSREKKKAYQSQYYALHREELNQRSSEYHDAHREEHAKNCRLYHETHREEILQRKAEYRRQNAPKIKAYFKTERGILATRAGAQNRRAQKRNSKGTHTTEELYQQLQRQKGKCYYCHAKLEHGRNNWHADHVVPLSKGGSNTIDNIVIACPPCNQNKFNRMPHEWEDGGRLL